MSKSRETAEIVDYRFREEVAAQPGGENLNRCFVSACRIQSNHLAPLRAASHVEVHKTRTDFDGTRTSIPQAECAVQSARRPRFATCRCSGKSKREPGVVRPAIVNH